MIPRKKDLQIAEAAEQFMKPVGFGRKISGLPIPNLIVYKGKRRMVRMTVRTKLMPTNGAESSLFVYVVDVDKGRIRELF